MLARSNGRRCFKRLTDAEVGRDTGDVDSSHDNVRRSQQRCRRGLRRVEGRSRPRADGHHHVGQHRLRVPCRRPVDHAPHVRDGGRPTTSRSVPTSAIRISPASAVGSSTCKPEDLEDAVIYQIGALAACARAAGGSVTYVKPHGALYNTIVRHEDQADAVANAVRLFDASAAVARAAGHRQRHRAGVCRAGSDVSASRALPIVATRRTAR